MTPKHYRITDRASGARYAVNYDGLLRYLNAANIAPLDIVERLMRGEDIVLPGVILACPPIQAQRPEPS